MSAASDVDFSRIALLEAIRHQGKEWDVLAPRYGVTNPNPPWKTSLIGMNECLAVGGALPALDRRGAEDELGEAVYRDVPAPERELLALVHTMLSRGLAGRGGTRRPNAAPFVRGSRRFRRRQATAATGWPIATEATIPASRPPMRPGESDKIALDWTA